MQPLLSLVFLLPLPFFSPVERTDRAAWGQLLAAFSQRGVLVTAEHPRCREQDLHGLYVRGSRTVVVCDRGDRSNTLRHEGWHLVQSLCLRGRPWLAPEQIDARLSRDDRLELQVLVRPERRQREAEARALAALKVDDYLRELDLACAGRLRQRPESPPPGGGGQPIGCPARLRSGTCRREPLSCSAPDWQR